MIVKKTEKIHFARNCKLLNEGCQFIESNCNRIKSAPDRFQHDDFHLGNIIINDSKYSGILDFDRYDRGDPLHEFVKLEWFTWPVSKEFARGEIKGYFGNEKG